MVHKQLQMLNSCDFKILFKNKSFPCLLRTAGCLADSFQSGSFACPTFPQPGRGRHPGAHCQATISDGGIFNW